MSRRAETDQQAISDCEQQTVLGAFDKQIGWCESLGSPFTARLLAVLRDDIAIGGASAELTHAWPGDPVADALALRLAAALHALALTGSAPALAACYPPSAPTMAQLRAVVLSAVREHQTAVRAFLVSPPQTNEVGRSGVLVGGFLQIAKETGLPLRCLEIGASAGLNAIWDRYCYQLGAVGWGDPQSGVRIAPTWEGPSPPIDAPIRVIERLACDVAPVDLEDPVQRLRLRAYVWADQRERLSRLEGAIELARVHGPRVERADAAKWVRARLNDKVEGARPSSTIPSCGNICRQRPRRISERASRTPGIARPARRPWSGCVSSPWIPSPGPSFASPYGPARANFAWRSLTLTEAA
jgi:hypothetical protein